MQILDFQKPDEVVMISEEVNQGSFEFRPLEPGYGLTVGNALRRVLLSSLEGYAITSVRITGADHEFTTIQGIVQDVTEIILNLKQVSSFGKDSIIGYLSENNGLGIGIGINPKKFSWVTIHVCEESAKVPYRFYKNFFGFNLKSKKKVSEK